MSDTSLMLLLAKASRKLRRNGLGIEFVEDWLGHLVGEYDRVGGGQPHCSLLARAFDDDEPASLVMALLENDTVTVVAGQGPNAEVIRFVQEADVDGTGDIVARARQRFTLQDREISLPFETINEWAARPGAGPSHGVIVRSSLTEVMEGEPAASPPMQDAELLALLNASREENQVNHLSVADIKAWLVEFLEQLDAEISVHPEEAERMQWDLLAADHSSSVPAVFCIAELAGGEASLTVGRGAGEAVRAFGEDYDEERSVIAAARQRFDMLQDAVVFGDRRQLAAWASSG